MAPLSPAKALAKVQQLQKGQDGPNSHLAIIRISEPITSALDIAELKRSPSKRTSDASADALDNPTPASLEADLTHYKVRTETRSITRISRFPYANGEIVYRSYSRNSVSRTSNR